MDKSRILSGARGLFLVSLAFILATDLAVLLHIPVLSQVLGFLFLTFAPGLLIIFIFRLHNLGLTEKIVLSAGLSIAFSMFAGLLINAIYPLFGLSPLSPISVTVSFSVLLLILTVLACLRNRSDFSINWSQFKLQAREKASLSVPVLFPVLSVLGSYLLNTTGNNIVVIVMFALILAYIILVVVAHRQVPERIYPAIIFLLGLSIVLLLGFRSNHIIGRDTHQEYYVFQLTFSTQQWQSYYSSPLWSCLSITILPTIYQCVVDTNPEYLFKILFPVFMSFSPLVTYIIARKYVGDFYAFLVSFFFISQYSFFFATALARNNLAVLFFLLAIMVLFRKSINEFARRTLFYVFSASCIVSHYSSTYIFLFILLATFLLMQILVHTIFRKKEIPTAVTMSTVAIFMVLLFFWYSQVTGPAFGAGVGFIKTSFLSLWEIFIMGTRETLVQQAFGVGIVESTGPVLWKFVLNWVCIALIAIGLLITLVRYRKMLPVFGKQNRAGFLHSEIDIEYYILSVASCVMILLTIIFPWATLGYGVNRVYFQTIGILGVFFIIGGMKVAEFLRLKPWVFLLLVLIPFFMGTAGLADQMFHRDILLLNSQGLEYNNYYIHDQESYAARWTKEYAKGGAGIYAGPGERRLVSQGKFPPSQIKSLDSLYQKGKGVDDYIYLRLTDIASDGLVAKHPDILAGSSKIYANGGSEVYR